MSLTFTFKPEQMAELKSYVDECCRELCQELAEETKRLTAERDEWEERYHDLLSRCGGTIA